MNRSLRFFDYEQCYNHYVRSFESIRQKRINGETIVTKPVLMVALIDGIDANVFPNNQFVINDWLEGRYKKLMINSLRTLSLMERLELRNLSGI